MPCFKFDLFIPFTMDNKHAEPKPRDHVTCRLRASLHCRLRLASGEARQCHGNTAQVSLALLPIGQSIPGAVDLPRFANITVTRAGKVPIYLLGLEVKASISAIFTCIVSNKFERLATVSTEPAWPEIVSGVKMSRQPNEPPAEVPPFGSEWEDEDLQVSSLHGLSGK